ncbi:basic proline-rich protein-like [Heliangelus exortis]|uniref:basic proline-rich protein-like n=1 Tax=Heliangelus exortis TaxID=472823 RepID=UPI003A94F6E0
MPRRCGSHLLPHPRTPPPLPPFPPTALGPPEAPRAPWRGHGHRDARFSPNPMASRRGSPAKLHISLNPDPPAAGEAAVRGKGVSEGAASPRGALLTPHTHTPRPPAHLGDAAGRGAIAGRGSGGRPCPGRRRRGSGGAGLRRELPPRVPRRAAPLRPPPPPPCSPGRLPAAACACTSPLPPRDIPPPAAPNLRQPPARPALPAHPCPAPAAAAGWGGPARTHADLPPARSVPPGVHRSPIPTPGTVPQGMDGCSGLGVPPRKLPW